jgi:phenylpropionate dioxygenase-like ring-hydroxylating dioxygenase large terminal subunit
METMTHATDGETEARPVRAPEVTALIERLRQTACKDVAEAQGMPPGVYTSPLFYETEQAAIFGKDWLCLGRIDDVPNPGDYLVSDIGALSVIALRGRDGLIRGFANTCLHRMARLLEGRGNCGGRIVCPYHAWAYRDDGRLAGAMHMERTSGFDIKALRLRELRTEIWGGFIFATLNPAIAPVAERLKPIEPTVARFRMDGYGKVLDLDLVTDANWKLIHENFMETYHLFQVHRTSLGTQEPIGAATGFDASDAYSIQRTVKYDDSPRGHAHPANTVLDGEWRRTTVVLCVFPALLLILCPDHLWYFLTHPAGVDRTRIRFGLSYAPEVLADSGRLKLAAEWKPYYENLNAEDKAIVESVQRAASSPLAQAGPLSFLERYTVDLARYLLTHFEQS